MEFKSFRMDEIKTDEGSDGLFFEGYASVFGNKDLHSDIIEHGAFKKTISERMPKGLIKTLWQHDEPFGKPVELVEDDNGLFVKSKVVNTQANRDRLEYMKEGVVDRMSIGYSTIKSSYDSERKANILKEIKLYEVSPVTFAANEQTAITGFKNQINRIANGEISHDLDMDQIKQAIHVLQSLIPESEPDISTQVKDEPNINSIDAELYQSMLKELREFRSK